MTLEHISSVTLGGYIYNNSQKYIAWVKIIHFYLMSKIWFKIMFHEDILYISYRKYIKT